MDAPKEIGLVSNGVGGYRLWNKHDDGDDGLDAGHHYLLAAPVEAELATLRKQLAEVTAAAKEMLVEIPHFIERGEYGWDGVDGDQIARWRAVIRAAEGAGE